MLTLDSKFADYIGVLKAAGACEEVMSFHDKMLAEKPDLTVGDVYKVFQADATFQDAWCGWAMQLIGKDLGEDVRAIIIDKIKSPMVCLKLAYRCPFLSEDEVLLLKAKYESQGDDVARAIICLDAILKSREFNLVRVEAVTTCKSITEAKTLIKAKTDVVTTVSADSAVKSADEIKKILETDRTKVTLATNEVMRSQGFVDEKGNGSVSVFESWLEGA
jgi:hypothetical protein